MSDNKQYILYEILAGSIFLILVTSFLQIEEEQAAMNNQIKSKYCQRYRRGIAQQAQEEPQKHCLMNGSL